MHDIPDVETEDPVVLAVVFNTKRTARRDFILLLDLELIHLLIRLERYLESFLLRHPVLEEVSSLLEIQLADRPELLLNAYQLLDDNVYAIDLLLENFNLFRYILAAAAIRSGRTITAAFGNATLARTG